MTGPSRRFPLRGPRLDIQRYERALQSLLGSASFASPNVGSRFAYFPLRCEDNFAERHPSTLDVLLSWVARTDMSAVALTGEFGTGKTTTCIVLAQQLLRRLGRRKVRFPLYVPVNRAAASEDPENFLRRVFAEYGLGDAAAFTRSHAVCFILDGLEAPEDYFDNPVAEFAMRLRTLPGRLVVFAARRYPRSSGLPSSTPSDTVIFDACARILQMDVRDQRRYMDEVHGAAGPHSTRARHVLESLTAVQAQLDRPLLLELAMLAPRPKDGRLPTSLTALFDIAISNLLALDHTEAGLAVTDSAARTLFNNLSYRMHTSGEEEVDLDTALGYIGTVDTASDAIAPFLGRCRLLRDIQGRVAFAHRSLQEFFTASALRTHIGGGQVDKLSTFLVREPVLSMTAELIRSSADADAQRTFVAEWVQRVIAHDVPASVASSGPWLAANVLSLANRLGLPLSGISLNGIELRGANLKGADLTSVTITSCDLSGVDFGQAKLDGGEIKDSSLQNVFLQNTSAAGARFVNCDFWNIRWLEEPHALWSARWIDPGHACAVALSTGHIQIVPFEAGRWRIDRAHDTLVHASGVLEIAVSPAGDNLLASDRAGQLYSFHVGTPADAYELSHMWTLPSVHAGNIRRIRFSNDGQSFVTACRDGGVRVFLLDSRLPYRQHFRHQEPVMDADWSPDGRWIASAGYDGRVCLFDVDTESTELLTPAELPGRAGIVRAVSYSPSGSLLAVGDENGNLGIWSVAGDVSFIQSVPVGSQVFAIRFIGENSVLVGTWNGQFILVDLAAGGVNVIKTLPEVVRCIELSSEQYLLLAAWDGTLASATLTADGIVASTITFDSIEFPTPDDSGAAGRLFEGSIFVGSVGLSGRQLEQLRILGAVVQ